MSVDVVEHYVDGNELKFITVINEYKVIDFLRVFSHIVLQPAT